MEGKRMSADDKLEKLEKLAEDEGFDGGDDLVEHFATESVVPGICMNEGCDYSTNVEPDQRGGWCELCETKTVESCLSLAGVI